LIAGDTVGVIVLDDVATGHQLLVTVVAGQVVFVVVLLHSLRILSGKYQLQNITTKLLSEFTVQNIRTKYKHKNISYKI
jgi:hypothetical protein